MKESIFEVLSDHQQLKGVRDHKAHCACEWVSKERGETVLRHREHLAEVLATIDNLAPWQHAYLMSITPADAHPGIAFRRGVLEPFPAPTGIPEGLNQ